MSKHSNVNPDHYKQAGRDRPGEDVLHGEERAERERAGRGRQATREEPHIPNQERASTPKPEASASDNSEEPNRLTEGMID